MNFFGFYVLNLEPTILSFLTSSNGKMYVPPEWLQPTAVVEHIPWWHGKADVMLRRKAQQLAFSIKGIEHHLMVHAQDEEKMRRRFGVRGSFISQNIYISEEIFELLEVEKLYDAVYVAQLKPFKRHELARAIKHLYIACSGDLKSFCPAVAHASFSEKGLDRFELAKVINQSYCSLALSAVEGGMLASFESLLCGVPVVSTPSKGGRDEFFDTENAIIVSPEAKDVAAAVEHWKVRTPDPQAIRATALARLADHRQRFCEYVAAVIRSHGGEVVSPNHLYDRYFNRSGGMSSRFIWANRFDDSSQLEKVQNN